MSYTSSVNRAADSEVSSTHNHLSATLFSNLKGEDNTHMQFLVKFQSLVMTHSRHQLIQKPVQFTPKNWTLSSPTQEVQIFRARSPGSGPLPLTAVPITVWDKAISGLSQIKRWREVITATYSTPLWSCFGEQIAPHLADKNLKYFSSVLWELTEQELTSPSFVGYQLPVTLVA